MEEWIIDQFLKNLEEFGLDKPWFWDTFMEELDTVHHTYQLGLYTYRRTLWFDMPVPSPDERAWLNEKYPATFHDLYEGMWEMIEANWRSGNSIKTDSYSLPSLCNLCQLPAVSTVNGRFDTCTYVYGNLPEPFEGDRRFVFCSEPCRWIFQQQPERFAGHLSVVDRVFFGDAPTDLNAVIQWFGFESKEEEGRDLHGGNFPWPAPASA